MSVVQLTQELCAQAEALGMTAIGIARAEVLPDDRQHFAEQVARGYYEGLSWMTAERAVRATDPALALAGARSVVSLALPYYTRLSVEPGELGPQPRGRVARYAWGRDYHRIFESKLRRLCRWLEERAPGERARALVDYGPLAERAYAARAGLGWTGKSTNLLIPGVGSWVLLGELLTTAELAADPPLRKTCGACTRCISGCPTDAILAPFVLDSRRCISFQTIEQREAIPRALRPLHGDWLFGCDVCQDVCPVPSRHTVAPYPDLTAGGAAASARCPAVEAAAPDLFELLLLDNDAFRKRFQGRAVQRAKRDGLLRNACVVLGNIGDDRSVGPLSGALADAAPIVRSHAAWALGRIGGRAARLALGAALGGEPDPGVREELIAACDAPQRVGGGYDPERLAGWLHGRG